MAFRYKRDDEALKHALETHTVDGMEVVVPLFREAEIIDQGATGPVKHITPGSVELGSPYIYYRVKAKNPHDFQAWLQNRYPRKAVKAQMTLQNWEEVFKEGLPPIPDYLMSKLEKGGTLSITDLEYDSLLQRGCIDMDNNVTCYTFWSSQVDIAPEKLKRGQLVEYEYLGDKNDSEKRRYPGSIVGFTKDKQVAYLELFTPMPFMHLPNSIWAEGIEPSFYSPYTHALGYGTHEAFEIVSAKRGQDLIPPGIWDSDEPLERLIYTLKEFIPLSVVEKICKAAYGKEPLCILQSLIVYVVPIMLYDKTYRGIWHPLPEKAVQVDAVISYEDEDEG